MWTTKILKNEDGELFINFPPSLIEQLDWRVGDRIEHDIIENYFDWGEVTSIILRNLTQEISNRPSEHEYSEDD